MKSVEECDAVILNDSGKRLTIQADIRRPWGEDPLVLSETKGTPEVHERVEVVN